MLIAVLTFMGATVWPIPLFEQLPSWVGVAALAFAFVVTLSTLPFMPWGKLVNRYIIQEDNAYRASLDRTSREDTDHAI